MPNAFDAAWALLKEININDHVEELDLYAAMSGQHDTHSCFDFAEMLHSNLTASGIEAEIQAPKNDTTMHRWVYVPENNKHYDAYSLYNDGDGEEDWRNLSYWYQLSNTEDPHTGENIDWHEEHITPQSESVRMDNSMIDDGGME
tara:strand:+ start:1859 stop:2293 length:435 start_codon:yes stop_codon:yes gene_type:complete